MKKKLTILVVLTSLMTIFAVCSHATIQKCDVSIIKGGGIDGRDLAQFAAYFAASDSRADVDESLGVNSSDVAHFAGFFGDSYRLPNILLIIADDVGIDMTTNMYPGLIDSLETIYGTGSGVRGTPASTPKLDVLAQQGKVFSNAWAQPFCSPTRATIITGMFAAKTNVKAYDEPMTNQHTTFVQRLKAEAGYSTAIIGKWHMAGGWSQIYGDALPQQMGFDLFKGHLLSALADYWTYDYHVQDESTIATPSIYRTESAPERSLPDIAPTTYAPVVRAADTVQWITEREAENPDKPWFAWLAFNQAHVAVGGTGTSVPLYHVPNLDTMDEPTRIEIQGCGGVPGTSYNANQINCTPAQFMRAMTNSMDTVIGEVLEVVDSIPSETYVVFIGDNGTWSTVMDNMYITKTGRGKTTPYESGARVPMVIRGPGITPNSQSDEFVHAADLFSTCLELGGLEVALPNGQEYTDFNGNPTDLDGVSLVPILLGSIPTVREPDHDFLLTEVGAFFGLPQKVGARNATYKVICQTNTSSSNCIFYNLVADPLEETQLSKPGSCTNYDTNYDPTDQEWHYCRLIEAINLYSIFP